MSELQYHLSISYFFEGRSSKEKADFNGGKGFPNFWEIFRTNFVLGQKSIELRQDNQGHIP